MRVNELWRYLRITWLHRQPAGVAVAILILTFASQLAMAPAESPRVLFTAELDDAGALLPPLLLPNTASPPLCKIQARPPVRTTLTSQAPSPVPDGQAEDARSPLAELR